MWKKCVPHFWPNFKKYFGDQYLVSACYKSSSREPSTCILSSKKQIFNKSIIEIIRDTYQDIPILPWNCNYFRCNFKGNFMIFHDFQPNFKKLFRGQYLVSATFKSSFREFGTCILSSKKQFFDKSIIKINLCCITIFIDFTL